MQSKTSLGLVLPLYLAHMFSPAIASTGGLPPLKPTVVQAKHVHAKLHSQRIDAEQIGRNANQASDLGNLDPMTNRAQQTPIAGVPELTPEALRLAHTLAIDSDLEKLSKLTHGPDQSTAQTSSNDLLKTLLLKQSLTEAVVYESFEVRSCLSNLETEIAQADDLQAFLEERRDKVIRLNTIANFISGGVTGIIGGALKIGGVNEQSANGIDTGEGITQTALALLALKQQAGEKKIVEGTPNMLTKLFDINASHSQRDYPPSVWNYLTSVPENSSTGLTRQQTLMKRWQDLKVINTKASQAQRREAIGHITGTHPQPIVSIDLLDARSAMLHDVRAVVSEMDHPLLELMQTIRNAKIQ
ncbi:MAG: hypothetical protein WC028_20935 [Candidatus Obscuribacterales bacterium]